MRLESNLMEQISLGDTKSKSNFQKQRRIKNPMPHHQRNPKKKRKKTPTLKSQIL